MKVGISLPNYGKAASKGAIDRSVDIAEKYAFDSVWTADHLLVPKKFHAPYGKVLESLCTLSYLAGRTERVKLGTGIIILPMREAVLLARQIAAIQIFSNGRLLLGLGSGWNETEFQNVRADFRTRGKYYDEGISLLRSLMSGSTKFFGQYYSITDAIFDPIPRKMIPIFVGGNGLPSLRRAAKLGDGWFPIGISPAELEADRHKLRSLTQRRIQLMLRLTIAFSEGNESIPTTRKSSRGVIETILAGSSSQILEQIERYRRAGLDHLICYFGDKTPKVLESAQTKFAKEVLPSL